MKVQRLFFAALTGALLFTACKGEQKPAQQAVNPDSTPVMSLSAYDTATVQRLTNDYLQLLVDKKTEEAVGLLYVLDNDTPVPLTASQQQEYAFALDNFDYQGFCITSYVFHSETDTEVEYELYLDNPASSAHPRNFKGLIRPVRRNGAWYLTLANDFNK